MLKIYIPKNIIIHNKKRNYKGPIPIIDVMKEKKSKNFDKLKTGLVKGYGECWMEM